MIMSDLRPRVETSKTLLDLYRVLSQRLAHLSVESREALRRNPKTQAFRTQLDDSLQTITVPKLGLRVKGALCSIVDQCEDEEERDQLCEAILQHIGGDVEMYVSAILVDPDQHRYQGQSFEGIL